MAIVWPTELDVDMYVAAGREVVVPRPDCPRCRQPMPFWGWYERDVRVSAEVIHRLSVRRARCCERTHALLPGFVTWGRLDAVEVIGSALETMCAGRRHAAGGWAVGLGAYHGAGLAAPVRPASRAAGGRVQPVLRGRR